MKTLSSIIILTTLLSCFEQSRKDTPEKKEKNNLHFIEFTFKDKEYKISGKSDVHSYFYIKQWPDYHTPEKTAQTRLDNQNIFCGRITTEDYSQMVEIFFNFNENKKLEVSDLDKELHKKRYTYNDTAQKPLENTFRLYFYNTTNEYTSDIDSEGYVILNKINETSDSTITAEGELDLFVREYGNAEVSKLTGNFRLEFYIGL